MTPKHKSLLSRLCAAVLALLGFASCEKFNDIRCEYGTPSVDFKVKGTVTDADEKPIEGIRVVIRRPYNPYISRSQQDGGDTIYTNAEGKYESPIITDMSVQLKKAYYDDADGAAGGEFASDSVEIYKAPKTQFKEASGAWYDGGFEYTVDVQLQKRKN